jgi:predicted transcriptional regulator
MEVQFTPDVQAKLDRLAMDSGRPANELLQDAFAGYFDEVAELRQTLDSRYDDLKSGRVKPVDGEEFFEGLRRREEDLLKKHPPQ